MTQNEITIKIKFNCHSMAIPWWFSNPLAARVSLPFYIHAKRNFAKKSGFTKVQTYNHANVKSMHNHSTNSCFMIILINIRLYYHSS